MLTATSKSKSGASVMPTFLLRFGRLLEKFLGKDVEAVEDQFRRDWGIFRRARHSFGHEFVKFLIGAVDQVRVPGSAGQNVP